MRYAMEVKRELDVLDRHLAETVRGWGCLQQSADNGYLAVGYGGVGNRAG